MKKGQEGPLGPEPLLVPVAYVAALCGVSRRQVWRLVRDPQSGFPRPRRLGGCVRWPLAALQRYVAEAAA